MTLYVPSRSRVARKARGWPSDPYARPKGLLKLKPEYASANQVWLSNQTLTETLGSDPRPITTVGMTRERDGINSTSINDYVSFRSHNIRNIGTILFFCTNLETDQYRRLFGGTFSISNGINFAVGFWQINQIVTTIPGTGDDVNKPVCFAIRSPTSGFSDNRQLYLTVGREYFSVDDAYNIPTPGTEDTIFIANRGGSNQNVGGNGVFQFALVDDRAWSEAEIEAWLRDPWSIWEPANSLPFSLQTAEAPPVGTGNLFIPARSRVARKARGELFAPFATPKKPTPLNTDLFGPKHFLIDFTSDRIYGNMKWTSTPLSNSGNYVGRSVDRGKTAYVYNASGAVNLGDDATIGDITTTENFSMVVYFREISTSGSTNFLQIGGGANGAVILARRAAAGDLQVTLSTSGSDYQNFELAGTLSDGDEVVFGVAWNTSAGTAELRTHNLTTGEKVINTASGLGEPRTTTAFSFFGSSSQSRAFYLIAADYRLWSDAELERLVFKGDFNRLYAPSNLPFSLQLGEPPVVEIPTLSNIAATSKTASSVIPQIDVTFP